MGASRSASIVIYYLMKKYNYSLNDAIVFCKNKRLLVNPTILFYDELSELEKQL
jgi:protein-tyrosine phosphatase